MIPRAYITEWRRFAPWKENSQVEQDLIICRALTEIYNDEFLSSRLAFRGGTAIHKLFLDPQPRYSEDIDLVQISSEPIKETIKHLQERLSFLGKAVVKQTKDNNTLIFRFESEIPPIQKNKLKIEINCLEHFSVLGIIKKSFETKSQWFSDSCELTIYNLDELMGTKLRALYQRKKGRDLYDLFKGLITKKLDPSNIIKCYKTYIKISVNNPPTQKQFLINMDAKMKDDEFLGDTVGLIRPEDKYDPYEAYKIVRTELIEKI